MLQRSSARYVIMVYLCDMAFTAAALLCARWLRLWLPFGKTLDAAGTALHWPIFVLVILIWTVTLAAFHVYDPHRFVDANNELQTTVVAIGAATLAFAGALYFSYRGLSRLLYVYFFIIDVLLCVAVRLIVRQAMQRRQADPRRRVLILGAGRVGQEIAAALGPAAWMGVTVWGFLDDDPAQMGQSYAGIKVLGPVRMLQQTIQDGQVQEVIIALPMTDQPRLADMVADLQALPVNIKVVPDYSDLTFYRNSLEQIGGTLVIGLKEPVIGPIDRLIKRCFDLLVATLGLILLTPLLLIIAAAIKLGSFGPVLYRSRRIGEGGAPFDMLKFRTMAQGADAREQELITENVEGQLVFDKRADDPRITPLGHWLRRYSLDELPQLWNVVRGEMSLVGPRPELPALVERYAPWQRKRFGVPQGITGWWQVSGRSNKAKHLHVEDDLYYIRNYSPLLDLRILAQTLGAVIRGDGAF